MAVPADHLQDVLHGMEGRRHPLQQERQQNRLGSSKRFLPIDNAEVILPIPRLVV